MKTLIKKLVPEIIEYKIFYYSYNKALSFISLCTNKIGHEASLLKGIAVGKGGYPFKEIGIVYHIIYLTCIRIIEARNRYCILTSVLEKVKIIIQSSGLSRATAAESKHYI